MWQPASNDRGRPMRAGAATVVEGRHGPFRAWTGAATGPESGAPVVLVHGLLTSGEVWAPVAPWLPPGRRLVAPDLRGHGGTKGAAADVTLEALVDDLVDLLDGLAVERAVLVGLSLGGLVCLRAALRQPERAEGLALVATPLAAETAESRARRLGTLEAMSRLGNRRVLRGMAAWLFGPTTRRRFPETVERWLDALEAADPAAIRRTSQAALDRPDARPWLAQIGVPTVLVLGGEDALVPAGPESERAARALGVDLRVVPEAGHLVPLEQPEALGRTLERWIDSADGRLPLRQGGPHARTVA